MDSRIEQIQALIDQKEDNLRLIEQRKSEYVLETDIPLQLIREARNVQKDLEKLREELNSATLQVEQEEKFAKNAAESQSGAASAVLMLSEDDVQIRPQPFIGRITDLKAIHAKLDLKQSVLLHGFPGTGKSALAAEVTAQRILRGEKPVVWLRAGTLNGDAVFEAIAETFGKRQDIAPLGTENRVHVCRTLLQENGVRLITLDNAWDVDAIDHVIKAAPKGVPVLVTSQIHHIGLSARKIDVLKPQEALQLLASRQSGKNYSSDRYARRLCSRLGYLAFAVYVAAHMLEVDNLTPRALLALIDEAPDKLTIGKHSVFKLLDASLSHLDPEASTVYLGMGALFSPNMTADLLARYLGTREVDTERGLRESLGRRGLVERLEHVPSGIPYFRVHTLAHTYLRERKENKTTESQEQAFKACVSYATAHKDNIGKLDVEMDQLLSACEKAGGQTLVTIMSLLSSDGGYLAAKGYTDRQRSLIDKAAADSTADVPTAHGLRNALAYMYAYLLGKHDRGIEEYEKALKLARQADDPHLEAMSLTYVGTVHFDKGKRERNPQNERVAFEYYLKAKRLMQKRPERRAVCQLFLHLGYFYMSRSESKLRYDTALWLADEAVKQAEGHHELSHLYFHALRNRGGCELELSRAVKDKLDIALLKKALNTHQQAYKFAKDRGQLAWMADALESIGEDNDALREYYDSQGANEEAGSARKEAQSAFESAYALWKKLRANAKAQSLADFMNKLGYLRSGESSS